MSDETTTATPDTEVLETTTTTEAAPAALGTEAPPVVETPTLEEREIEGRVNGQPYKIKVPTGFEIPWKRGSEEGHASFDEVLKSPNFERDYQHKMQALARDKREWEAQRERERVEVTARNEQAAENRRRMLEAAAQGGEALERERRHQRLLETDPDYRMRWDESEEYRIRERIGAYDAERVTQAQNLTTAEAIRGYIAREAEKYPGVDPERVAKLYRQALQAGDFGDRIHADDVDAVLLEEAALVERGRGTVMTELEQIRAELAALKAEKAAGAHNAKVAAAVERTAKPQAGQRPARGAVPGEAPFAKFDPAKETEQEFRARWNARYRVA